MTPQRLARVKRLVDAQNGEGAFDRTMALIDENGTAPETKAQYVELLVLRWLGDPRGERSDRGVRRGRRTWVYVGLTCESCGEPFKASRADARFCSARCRQRARRSVTDN